MGRTFEQFVKFGTDAEKAGLERTFRLFQATAQILTSYTLPFTCLLYLLDSFSFSLSTNPSSSSSKEVPVYASLLLLRSNLALARRYFRIFRFLESFGTARKLLSSSQNQNQNQKDNDTVIWLDIFKQTFNGMYLLLESSTFFDAIGLQVWGKEMEKVVSVEGQRFWVVSDGLDILIPGSIVGWIPVDAGIVGLAMFVTTVLTSVDIWDRCGREVVAAAGGQDQGRIEKKGKKGTGKVDK
ncbi:hypothetical protein GGS20DRAFT_429563 [Poronia punctata]|nr:hypothetical protein GGS20DRAFT_429563 [Poronia punctata]